MVTVVVMVVAIYRNFHFPPVPPSGFRIMMMAGWLAGVDAGSILLRLAAIPMATTLKIKSRRLLNLYTFYILHLPGREGGSAVLRYLCMYHVFMHADMHAFMYACMR